MGITTTDSLNPRDRGTGVRSSVAFRCSCGLLARGGVMLKNSAGLNVCAACATGGTLALILSMIGDAEEVPEPDVLRTAADVLDTGLPRRLRSFPWHGTEHADRTHVPARLAKLNGKTED